MEAHLNTGPELAALRKTSFYRQFRPFIKSRAAQRGFAADFLVREEDDPKLSATDRFYFGLEFIFGDLLRNVRSRLWIKAALQKMIGAERIDEVGAHFLYRAYLNELVVLMERLQRLIALLKRGLDLPTFVAHCETEVLQFFNPLLSEKRNANHHALYMGYPRSPAVEALINGGHAAEALRLFREVMGKEIKWMDYTEQEFAKFLSGFLDRVHAQLKIGDGYVEPTRLPATFRLSSRLDGNLRGKHDHAKVFGQTNGG